MLGLMLIHADRMGHMLRESRKQTFDILQDFCHEGPSWNPSRINETRNIEEAG